MDSPGSAGGTDSPGRKRPRSSSELATATAAPSTKRGASEDRVLRSSPSSSPPMDVSLPPPSLLSAALQMDDYMESQGEATADAPLHTDLGSPTAPTSTEPPPSPEKQLSIIESLKKEPIVGGSTWFVVAKDWYDRWHDACSPESASSSKHSPAAPPSFPGPIDNTSITQLNPYPGCQYDLTTEPPVAEGISCEFIPKQAHQLFVQWFGSAKYPYEYTARSRSPLILEGNLELYPRIIRLYTFNKNSASSQLPPVYIPLSRQARLADLFAKHARIPLPPQSPLSGLTGEDNIRVEYQVSLNRITSLGDAKPWNDVTPLTSISDLDLTLVYQREANPHLQQANADMYRNTELSPVMNLDSNSNGGGSEYYSPFQALEDALIESRDSLVLILNNPDLPDAHSAIPAAPAPPPPATTNSGGIRIFDRKNDYFKNMSDSAGLKSSGSTALTLAPKDKFTSSSFLKSSRMRGTMGLNNLGNTCFMNSALQCLAHLPELTEYFLRGVYVSELNPDNPLSTGGVLAKSYGDLLKALFESTGSSSSFAPRDFKHKISTHAPQFSGYMQHDSQELLAFLLDGLHEDLNRVLKKPYVERLEWKDGGGKKEFWELARGSWEGYKTRNDSVIVDLFQGQYRSTLVCPECEKVSITFDPFMYLTLPLPIKKMWSHDVFYIPWDPEKPNVKTRIELPVNNSIKQLKQKVAELFESEASRLFATDFWQGKWYRVYADNDMISDINNNDKTVIYELPIPLFASAAGLADKEDEPATENKASSIEVSDEAPQQPLKRKLPPYILPVYHTIREEPQRTSGSSFGTYRRGGIGNNRFDDGKLFGIPTFVLIEQENEDGEVVGITPERIYEAALEQYRRWTERADHLYDWTTASPAQGLESQKTEAEGDEFSTAADPVSAPSDVKIEVDAAAEVDGDAIKVDYEPPAGPPPVSPQPVFVGPKKDLFKVTLREATSTYATKQQQQHDAAAALGLNIAYDSTRQVSWADRTIATEEEETAPEGEGDIADESKGIDVDKAENQDEQAPKENGDASAIEVDTATTTKVSSAPHYIQLQANDVLRCEWDPHLLEYYFGPQGKGDGALWERFTIHTDPTLPTPAERAAAARKTITLEDCLDEFCREELLGEDDLWYCPHCKKHQQATKQFQIWAVPDILVVHLKRFSNSRVLRDKIDALVEFPVESLDLSSRVGEKLFRDEWEKEHGDDLDGPKLENIEQESMIYDLFAVDEHLGGMGGGHYRAHALNTDDNQWYWFDDAHVSKCRPEDAINSNAYLLFYRRRTDKPIGGETHELLERALHASRSGAIETEEEPSPIPQHSSRSGFFRGGRSPVIGPLASLTPTSSADELPSFEAATADHPHDFMVGSLLTIDDDNVVNIEVDPFERATPDQIRVTRRGILDDYLGDVGRHTKAKQAQEEATPLTSEALHIMNAGDLDYGHDSQSRGRHRAPSPSSSRELSVSSGRDVDSLRLSPPLHSTNQSDDGEKPNNRPRVQFGDDLQTIGNLSKLASGDKDDVYPDMGDAEVDDL